MIDLNLENMTDAQLRLYAVRCVRRVQRLMVDPRSLAALDVAERHARGEATDEELAAAWAAAEAARDATLDAADAATAWAAEAALAATYAAARAAALAAPEAAAAAAAPEAAAAAAWDAERAAQAEILEQIRKEVQP
jgi:hypothetical protein